MAYGDEQAKAAFIPSMMQTLGSAQQLQQQQGQMKMQEEQTKMQQLKFQQEQKKHEQMSKPRSLDQYFTEKGLDPNSKTYQFLKNDLSFFAKDGMITGYDLETYGNIAKRDEATGIGFHTALAEDAKSAHTKATEKAQEYKQKNPEATIDGDEKYASLIRQSRSAEENMMLAQAKIPKLQEAYKQNAMNERKREEWLEKQETERMKKIMDAEKAREKSAADLKKQQEAKAADLERKKTAAPKVEGAEKPPGTPKQREANITAAALLEKFHPHLKDDPKAQTWAKVITDPSKKESERKRADKLLTEYSAKSKKTPDKTDVPAEDTTSNVDKAANFLRTGQK